MEFHKGTFENDIKYYQYAVPLIFAWANNGCAMSESIVLVVIVSLPVWKAREVNKPSALPPLILVNIGSISDPVRPVPCVRLACRYDEKSCVPIYNKTSALSMNLCVLAIGFIPAASPL